jgi:hypothetical protein
MKKTIVAVGLGIVGIIGFFYLAHKGYLGNKVQTQTTNITSKVMNVGKPVDSKKQNLLNLPTERRNQNSIAQNNIIPFFYSSNNLLFNEVLQ